MNYISVDHDVVKCCQNSLAFWILHTDPPCFGALIAALEIIAIILKDNYRLAVSRSRKNWA